VNLPLADLDELARRAFRTNAALLKALGAVAARNAENAQARIGEAQQQNAVVLRQLERLGAADPAHALQVAEYGEEIAATLQPAEVPIELLSSEKARRYAEAMRSAAIACREMETERYGPGCDGFAEVLEDYADTAEFEVYGPRGLRE
jgi:hypothetical protein